MPFWPQRLENFAETTRSKRHEQKRATVRPATVGVQSVSPHTVIGNPGASDNTRAAVAASGYVHFKHRSRLSQRCVPFKRCKISRASTTIRASTHARLSFAPGNPVQLRESTSLSALLLERRQVQFSHAQPRCRRHSVPQRASERHRPSALPWMPAVTTLRCSCVCIRGIRCCTEDAGWQPMARKAKTRSLSWQPCQWPSPLRVQTGLTPPTSRRDPLTRSRKGNLRPV